MFQLPSGFTYSNEAPNFGEFKELCYSLQNLGYFKIKRIYDYEYADNYFKALVSTELGDFLYLQNCHVPYAAFCNTDTDEFEFIDTSVSTKLLKTIGYDIIILYKNILNLTIKDEHKIDKEEIKEISFFQSPTVGQVLFSSYE